MTLEKYSVTLSIENVEKAKLLCSDYGGKLSPLLDKLLLGWITEQEKVKGQIKLPEKKDKTKTGNAIIGTISEIAEAMT